jgi:hypothetical protein
METNALTHCVARPQLLCKLGNEKKTKKSRGKIIKENIRVSGQK